MNRNQFLTSLGALTGGVLLGRPAFADLQQPGEKAIKITDETSFVYLPLLCEKDRMTSCPL